MADIIATIALDDAMVRRGFRNLEGDALRFGRAVERGVSIGGKIAKLALGGAVLSRAFAMARREAELLNATLGELGVDAGRNTAALERMHVSVGILGNEFKKLWDKVLIGVAAFQGRMSKGLGLDDGMGVQATIDTIRMAEKLQKQAALTARAERDRGAAAISGAPNRDAAAEMQRHMDAMREINRDAGQLDRDDPTVKGARRAEMELHIANREKILESFRKERDEKKLAAEESHRDASRSKEDTLSQARIEGMRLEGREKEAELAELKARFDGRARDIAESALSASEKTSALAELDELSERAAGIVAGRRDTPRFQVNSASQRLHEEARADKARTRTEQRALIAEGEKQFNVLQRIERKIDQSSRYH